MRNNLGGLVRQPRWAKSAKTGRGQVQHRFLFRFHGSDNRIGVKGGSEFLAWKWMSFGSLLNSVVDFRKPIYQKLADRFGAYLSPQSMPDSQ